METTYSREIKPKKHSFLYKVFTNPQIRAPILFILPAFLIVIIFQTAPAIAGLILSFTKYGGSKVPVFTGLTNYIRMFNDVKFWNAIAVTVYYVVSTVIPSTLLGLGVAMALNTKWLWFKGVIRSVYFLPSVISLVSIALVWKWLLSPTIGPANEVLEWFGIPRQQFFGSPAQAMPLIIIIGVWRAIGFNMVIYLAGLQGIDRTYYEAALVDGANLWQGFRFITWPLLRPATFFIVSMGVIGGFQLFDLIVVMTRGGPIDTTRVIVYYLYTRTFQDLQFGFGSAMAITLFFIMMAFTYFQFRFFQGETEY